MLIFKGCADNLSVGDQDARQEQAAADSTPEKLANPCQIRRPPRHSSGTPCAEAEDNVRPAGMPGTRVVYKGWLASPSSFCGRELATTAPWLWGIIGDIWPQTAAGGRLDRIDGQTSLARFLAVRQLERVGS